MTTATTATTYYAATYHGRPDQVRKVRAAITAHLAGCPVIDDAVLIVSEITSNAVLHSRSKDQTFAIRCEACPGYVRIECEDLGGEWQREPRDDRPHGLDIVEALTGPGGWGIQAAGDGNRIVWARLSWKSGLRTGKIPAGQSVIVGANIRALRQRHGWTQARLGQLMGWPTTSTVCAAEGHRNHRQRGFTPAEIQQLAAIFGITPAQLTTRCATCGGHPPAGYACLTCGSAPRNSRPAATAVPRPAHDGHASARR